MGYAKKSLQRCKEHGRAFFDLFTRAFSHGQLGSLGAWEPNDLTKMFTFMFI